MSAAEMKTGELLLELFSEEIPARMQLKAAADLKKLVGEGLKSAGLKFDDVAEYVTPRRLTLSITDLPTMTAAVREERKGPRADAPEKAIEGFLRGAGVDRSACEERDMGKKGVVLFAVIEKPGRAAADVIAEVVTEVINKFPWPKSQRWGTGSLRWVRPLQRILCLFDGAVVPFTVGDIESCGETSGHRFLAPESFVVNGFEDYRERLLAAKVEIDHTKRQELIAARARELAAEAKLDWVEDKGLLSEVAGLVEWPVPMLASFETEFLEVPEEVLILTMKQDQRYFVLRNPETGKLAPNFIFVANIEPKDGGTAVIKGNERVIRARLADARFFWDQDLKSRLDSRTDALKDIVFHEKLGTVAERTDRMAKLARKLSHSIPGCDSDLAERAAQLSKADLVSAMVYEFPEVQGVMGRYYALNDGENAAVADAVRDHYSPLGPTDDCPSEPVSVAVALAEKLDTLIGFFGIKQPPTGSKDPYALRRAALGVIRLIVENKLRVNLLDVLEAAEHIYQGTGINLDGESIRTLVDFFADRLKVIERDKGTRHDCIDAVFAKGDDDLVRVLARVAALQTFLSSDDGENLHAGYKRANNILKAEAKKDALPDTFAVAKESLADEAEKNLFDALNSAKSAAGDALAGEDYQAAMAALATLRAPIDQFFDDVTVNADDAALRANRLSLLDDIRAAVNSVADFGLIEG